MTAPDFHVTDHKNDIDQRWLITAIQKSYWGHWQATLQIMRALDNSLILGAYLTASRQMIGCCVVVTNKATFSSVTDLIVDEAHRGRGVGRALAGATVLHPWVKPTICVLASRDASLFWAKFGFAMAAGDVMKRPPSP